MTNTTKANRMMRQAAIGSVTGEGWSAGGLDGQLWKGCDAVRAFVRATVLHHFSESDFAEFKTAYLAGYKAMVKLNRGVNKLLGCEAA